MHYAEQSLSDIRAKLNFSSIFFVKTSQKLEIKILVNEIIFTVQDIAYLLRTKTQFGPF